MSHFDAMEILLTFSLVGNQLWYNIPFRGYDAGPYERAPVFFISLSHVASHASLAVGLPENEQFQINESEVPGDLEFEIPAKIRRKLLQRSGAHLEETLSLRL